MDQHDPESNEMREKEKINLWEAKCPKHPVGRFQQTFTNKESTRTLP